jgi:HEAT repeat protein
VDAELLEIAEDAGVSKSKRGRAVHALGFFPTDSNRTWLVRALAGQDSRFARKSAYALSNGWGDAAISDLEGALRATDVQLRIAAASALGNLRSEAARTVLSNRLPDETESAVRQSIESAIAKR